MIKIGGVPFYDEPGSCGSCPFFSNGSTQLCSGYDRGHCRLFNEMHKTSRNIPRRCAKLFKKAFQQPDGSDLVIILKND